MHSPAAHSMLLHTCNALHSRCRCGCIGAPWVTFCQHCISSFLEATSWQTAKHCCWVYQHRNCVLIAQKLCSSGTCAMCKASKTFYTLYSATYNPHLIKGPDSCTGAPQLTTVVLRSTDGGHRNNCKYHGLRKRPHGPIECNHPRG